MVARGVDVSLLNLDWLETGDYSSRYCSFFLFLLGGLGDWTVSFADMSDDVHATTLYVAIGVLLLPCSVGAVT